MAEGESFDTWLSAFTSEVDSALKASSETPAAAPEARSAQASFDSWWKAEQQPITEPTITFEAAPAPASPPPASKEATAERLLPDELPSRLEKLAEDRARLSQKNDSLEQENRALRERMASVQSEIAEFEAKLSRSRRSYEEHIERVEMQNRLLQRQVEEKAALEKKIEALEREKALVGEELSLERKRADEQAKQLLELRARLQDLERQLAQARQDQAAQAGMIEELRRQASTYQHRLVQSKEATDNDVLSMRQELKTFLEDLRLIRNTMRKGE